MATQRERAYKLVPAPRNVNDWVSGYIVFTIDLYMLSLVSDRQQNNKTESSIA